MSTSFTALHLMYRFSLSCFLHAQLPSLWWRVMINKSSLQQVIVQIQWLLFVELSHFFIQTQTADPHVYLFFFYLITSVHHLLLVNTHHSEAGGGWVMASWCNHILSGCGSVELVARWFLLRQFSLLSLLMDQCEADTQTGLPLFSSLFILTSCYTSCCRHW